MCSKGEGEMEKQQTIDIAGWIKRCIEGTSGLLSFEKYELAVRLESDEVVAADWIIRCLANPNNEGSEDVLQAIIQRREDIKNGIATSKQSFYSSIQEKRISKMMDFDKASGEKYCWPNLFDMAVAEREGRINYKEAARYTKGCKEEAEITGTCWCGKFKKV